VIGVPPHSLHIVIDATEARVDSSLSLKDTIGTGNRLDVICRLLVAAFWWGTHLLRGVTVFIAFRHHPSLLVQGTLLQEPIVPKTELGFARLLKDVYVNGAQVPGFTILDQPIGDFIHGLQEKGVRIWWLEEGGQSLQMTSPKPGIADAFILGDHRGVSDAFITQYANVIPRISLGLKSYLGSSCIQLILGHLNLQNF